MAKSPNIANNLKINYTDQARIKEEACMDSTNLFSWALVLCGKIKLKCIISFKITGNEHHNTDCGLDSVENFLIGFSWNISHFYLYFLTVIIGNESQKNDII